MKRKTLSIKEMGDAGTGLARIATLSAVDSDGDTYQPGAFSWAPGGHQWVQILPAHDWRAMPLGKARIYEEGDGAFAELSLNLDTQAGRDWHAALKFDLANGEAVQEWSYGFDVVDADFQVRGDSRVRVLKRLDVFEVSPVLRGAGEQTGTLAIKGAALQSRAFDRIIADLSEMAEAVAGDLSVLSAVGVKQLGDIHAALGKALGGIELTEEEDASRDTLLAGYLLSMSRRHLPAGRA